MLRSTSPLVSDAPAWKTSLHAWDFVGNLSQTEDLEKVHNSFFPSRYLNFLLAQVKHHIWRLAVILNLKHCFCCHHQQVTSSPAWLTFAEALYCNNTSSIIYPKGWQFQQFGFSCPPHEALALLQQAQENSSGAQVQADECSTMLLPRKH